MGQQLARQLLDQGNVTEAVARAGIQSNTWRTGVLLHNLGSLLLELGRTTMTARLGQAPVRFRVAAVLYCFLQLNNLLQVKILHVLFAD